MKRYQIVETNPDDLLPGTKVYLCTDVDPAMFQLRQALRDLLRATTTNAGAVATARAVERARKLTAE